MNSLASATSALLTQECELCGTSKFAALVEKDGYRYARCVHCDLVRAEMDHFEPAALYDGLFESAWLEREIERTLEPRKQAIYRQQLRAAAKRAAFPRGTRVQVLDVGCGVGGFLRAAKELDFAPTGLEVSDVAARYAREQLGLDVRTGALDRDTHWNARFELVRANALLEHLPRPLEALRVLREAVAPGGVIFGLTLNIDSWTYERAGKAWRYLGMGGHVSFFNPRNLHALFEKAGFKDVRIRTQGFRDESRRMGRWREAWEGHRAARADKGHRLYFEARG